MDDTASSAKGAYKPRILYIKSKKKKHESKRTSRRHSRVDLGCVTTANNKTKASVAQLYITSAV